MNQNELISFLKENDRYLKKSLSQNFLIDKNIIDKIIKTSSLEEGDTVLEIGPGAGSLTQVMLKKNVKVIAVEKDTFFADKLTRFPGDLTVYCQDILKFDLSKIPKNTKVVANLPYNITTPIIAHLLTHHSLFSSITIMVQKEVGERICARAGSKIFGSLSVFIQFYSQANYSFTVSRNCFMPKPKVDSAIINLTLITPPLKDSEPFFYLVRTAFKQRRKMLCVSLKDLHPKEKVQKTLSSLKLNPESRPERLNIEDWLKLYEELG